MTNDKTKKAGPRHILCASRLFKWSVAFPAGDQQGVCEAPLEELRRTSTLVFPDACWATSVALGGRFAKTFRIGARRGPSWSRRGDAVPGKRKLAGWETRSVIRPRLQGNESNRRAAAMAREPGRRFLEDRG